MFVCGQYAVLGTGGEVITYCVECAKEKGLPRMGRMRLANCKYCGVYAVCSVMEVDDTNDLGR